MKNVLFVCTGNIFRSLTAEYALRSALSESANFVVSSAGTRNSPNARVRPDVAAYLRTKSLDVSGHQRRTLTQDMLSPETLVVAMSTDHQRFIHSEFGTDSLLYTEACGRPVEPLLDIDELFAREDHHGPAAQQHIYSTIDQIIELAPQLVNRLVAGWDTSP